MSRSNSPVVDAGDDTFEKEVLSADRPVLVEFGATWCGPCRALEPIVLALANERAATLKVVKIDIDDAPDVSKRYGIRGVPTVLIFDKGEIAARQTGVTTKAKLVELLPNP